MQTWWNCIRSAPLTKSHGRTLTKVTAAVSLSLTAQRTGFGYPFVFDACMDPTLFASFF